MKTALWTLLLASAASPAFAGVGNLLVNGDLELPVNGPGSNEQAVGWTLIEPDVDELGEPVNSASFESFANHTPGGERGLWLRSFEGGFGGDEPLTVNASLFQDVPAAAGAEYALSAWFRFEANYLSESTFLSIEFLDAGMNVLGSETLDINDVNPRDSVWRHFQVSGVSVLETAFVRSRVDMVDGMLAPANPQSAFVDDLHLVPAPSTTVLLGFAGLIAASRRRGRD